jgi:hypothetical protein
MDSILFVSSTPTMRRARIMAQMRARWRQLCVVLCDSSGAKPSRRGCEIRDYLRNAGVPVHRVGSVATLKKQLENLPEAGAAFGGGRRAGRSSGVLRGAST